MDNRDREWTDRYDITEMTAWLVWLVIPAAWSCILSLTGWGHRKGDEDAGRENGKDGPVGLEIWVQFPVLPV